MKYDDAEYYFLNFETDALPNEAGATHIGMFMSWLIQHDLVSEALQEEEQVAQVKARALTGREVVIDLCDCKLCDEDLSEEGNAFAQWYYEEQFTRDYGDVFDLRGETADAFCSVEDSWENFDRLAPVLDRRLAQWRARQT